MPAMCDPMPQLQDIFEFENGQAQIRNARRELYQVAENVFFELSKSLATKFVSVAISARQPVLFAVPYANYKINIQRGFRRGNKQKYAQPVQFDRLKSI